MPAILKVYWISILNLNFKGWLDRVYSYYFAYGGECGFAGKKWFTSVTTGGPKDIYKEGGFFGMTVFFFFYKKIYMGKGGRIFEAF